MNNTQTKDPLRRDGYDVIDAEAKRLERAGSIHRISITQKGPELVVRLFRKDDKRGNLASFWFAEHPGKAVADSLVATLTTIRQIDEKGGEA